MLRQQLIQSNILHYMTVPLKYVSTSFNNNNNNNKNKKWKHYYEYAAVNLNDNIDICHKFVCCYHQNTYLRTTNTSEFSIEFRQNIVIVIREGGGE